MSAQLPSEEKVRRCDFVIDNNGTKKKTLEQVRRLMELFKGGNAQWKN